MIKRNGLFKNVYVFKNFVVKTPRLFKWWSIHAMYCEQLNYVITKPKIKKYLLRIWFVPFVPISIQRRARVVTKKKHMLQFIQELEKDGIDIITHEVLHDMKPDNLGRVDGKIYKIDFDGIYILHNIKCHIKLKIKKWRGCRKK